MKNKKLLYVLIPATILVWGWVAYKLIGQFGGNDAAAAPAASYVVQGEISVVPDTFSLSGEYRDPFSDAAIKKVITPAGNAKPAAPAEKKLPVSWPEIRYGGIIRNQHSNRQLVLILVNRQSAIMKAGEIFSGIELLRVSRDSVELRFGKERKWIGK